jgi:succinyl-CoA synthetase alpha subunit
MLTAKAVKETHGIKEVFMLMGTEANLEILKSIGLSAPEAEQATPNDLVIAVDGETDVLVEEAFKTALERLHNRERQMDEEEEYRPVSLETALKMAPDANLVLISVPGAYAAREAGKALDHGLHVMLFSDNVSLEDEVRLKKRASEEGLLMMGPDCGTAVISGKPLGFANLVREGEIGLVAASGSGLQEVCCRIHDLGGGLSQAIGTGGRDLHAQVGGRMMLMGIEALQRDSKTKVIVVLSKPPAEKVAEKVVAKLEETQKPGVVHFVGQNPKDWSGRLRYAADLEEAAGMAVALCRGEDYPGRALSLSEGALDAIVERETCSMSLNQRYLRGLYAGGTLADEAMILLEREGVEVFSNIQTKPERILRDPHVSQAHSIIDLGEDRFTQGRPHPMIDSSIREERLSREMEDPEVALLLMDFVLGYGAHEDPCGAMLGALSRAKQRAEERGGNLSVVASIVGTAADFQDLAEQRQKLESAGCVVMPSNYQAAMLAAKILKALEIRGAH